MAYLISQLNGIKKFTYHLNFKTLLSTLYFLYIAKTNVLDYSMTLKVKYS